MSDVQREDARARTGDDPVSASDMPAEVHPLDCGDGWRDDVPEGETDIEWWENRGGPE